MSDVNGGEGGIRTHGPLARSTVFETAPFDHSGTSPCSYSACQKNLLSAYLGLRPAERMGFGVRSAALRALRDELCSLVAAHAAPGSNPTSGATRPLATATQSRAHDDMAERVGFGVRSAALRALRDELCSLVAAHAAPGSNPTSGATRPLATATQSRAHDDMAERVGFEPTVELPLHTISSRAPSATRSPLRKSRRRSVLSRQRSVSAEGRWPTAGGSFSNLQRTPSTGRHTRLRGLPR